MPFLLAAAGFLLTFSLPPFGWWPLLLSLVVPFTFTALAPSNRKAFFAGFWFAVPFFAVHLFWLPTSFSKLLSPAFWVIYPPLVLIVSAFWGLTTLATRFIAAGFRNTQPHPSAVLVLLPLTWVITEQLRSIGYFGFPWGTLGYQWLDSPVGQLAEYGGLPLLSLLSAAVAALVTYAALRRKPLLLAVPAAVLIAAFFLGVVTEQREFARTEATSSTRTALLVQGNLDPYARAISAWAELEAHQTLTAEGLAAHPNTDLVVWPEGAVTGSIIDGPRGAGLRADIAAVPGTTFAIGGRAYEQRGSYNSTFSFTSETQLGRYDKAQLVPFGERWPLYTALPGVYEFVFRALNLPLLAATLPGSGATPLPVGFGHAAAFICYESVFPSVVRQLVANGGTFLMLTTNDAWFAMGNGARQHYDMGRLRAIETRRWLLRAGNDGITGVVNTFGKTVHELPRGEAAWLHATFTERTELTMWVRYGQYATPVLVMMALLIGVIRRRA